MTAFIRLLYALLIALSVVAFVGVAIFSFYQPPKEPAYPDNSYSDSTYDQAKSNRAQKAYDKAEKQYQSKQKTYQRNVTIGLLAVTVPIVAGGLFLLKRSVVIGEGLALGGVATSIYAIISASLADARILRFVAVTFLLVTVLLISQLRFPREIKKLR